MFKRLGLGLTADDKYRRAFEKAVLLGNFGAAVGLFAEAAKEYERRGNAEGLDRAVANTRLYTYLSTGDPGVLAPLVDALRKIPEIECIGSATQTMPTSELVAELEARMAEAQIAAAGTEANPATLAALHERARDRFSPISSQKLITYAYVSSDPFKETAQSRFHLHAADASWHRAQAKLLSDPAGAAEEMSQALANYRLAGHAKGEEECVRLLAQLRITRTCWVCGREMQGHNLNFAYLPTTTRPYHKTVLEVAKQDLSTLLVEESCVAVCVVCQDLILNLARITAQQMVKPLNTRMEEVAEQVRQLAQVAHHH